MPVLTKAPTLGDLLKFECCGTYSREAVTLKAGTFYPLGSVLGRITATGAEAVGVVAARGPVILSEAALVFDASVDQPAERTAKLAQLAAAGLVARPTA